MYNQYGQYIGPKQPVQKSPMRGGNQQNPQIYDEQPSKKFFYRKSINLYVYFLIKITMKRSFIMSNQCKQIN